MFSSFEIYELSLRKSLYSLFFLSNLNDMSKSLMSESMESSSGMCTLEYKAYSIP